MYYFLSVILCLTVMMSPTVGKAQQAALFGVNLAAAEFGHRLPGSYGKDYTYPTAEELDYYKRKNLKLIRLPFAWERIQPTLNSPLDAAEVSHMTDFLNAADARGMHVILDAHNYGRYGHGTFSDVTNHGNAIGSSAVPVAAFADLWSRMARQFQGHPSLVGYDLMNEPHDMGGDSTWPSAAQAAVDAIRAADVTHYVFVEGDNWATADTWLMANNANLDINDPTGLIVYEAHQYFDRNSSATYSGSYDKDGGYSRIGVDRLQPFTTWLNQHHHRGWLGEYGVPDNDHRWLTVLDNLLATMRQQGIWGTYWAGGPWWGDNRLSCEPRINGKDAVQMSILQKYPSTYFEGRLSSVNNR